MNNPLPEMQHWSPAHAQRLRDLMHDKGWDEIRLALWTALSLRQVQALCADETEPVTQVFYTEQIKLFTGLRLIDKLTQAS
jgi:hypothetical protein